MPVLKNVLGLDLGRHSIKAVEFRQTLRGFEAVRMCLMPRGDPEEPLPELLRRFVEMHHLTTGHVVTALPGERVAVRSLDFPFRERRRLAQAVPFELASSVPYELDEYVIAWDLAREDRGRGEVLAAIAPRSEVSEAIDTLRQAGFEPRSIEAEGPVLANLASAFDLPGTRLIADIGFRKTTLCLLVEGHAVAARTVPVGGQLLTSAIAREKRLQIEEAERLKCEEGVFGTQLDPTGPSFQAVDRLARELVRSIGAFEPVLGSPDALAEITLCGGGAQLERLDEFLSERTSVPARCLGLPQTSGLAAGGSPLLFAGAIALGLRGTSSARTRLDFRKDEFAVRLDLSGLAQQFSWTARLAAAAVLLALLNFGAGVWIESRRAAQIEEAVARIYSEALPGRPPGDDPVASMREALQAAHQRAEFLGVYRGNLSALDLLTELSRHIPADLKISVEELSIERQTIRIRCSTETFGAADRLGAELARFPAFAQAQIGSIERNRKTGATNFDVTISLASQERA